VAWSTLFAITSPFANVIVVTSSSASAAASAGEAPA
jgi:hypothetical protein